MRKLNWLKKQLKLRDKDKSRSIDLREKRKLRELDKKES